MEKREMDIINNNSIYWRFYQDSRVLITGATGRIGMYILETLVNVDINYNLNMKIYGLARSQDKVNDIFGEMVNFPNVQFLIQDVNEPISLDENIDYIFHTAGPAAPVDFKNIPVETLWSHVNGTHNVLEYARTHNTKRVLYISTVEIYGEWKSEDLIKESDMGPLQHLNYRACYPEAKRLCETMLTTYKEEYGIDFCGVRCCHTLGPGISLNDGRAFAEFINCVLHGQNIVLQSSGAAMRTYTYVADVVNAIFMVMERGEGRFYNVAANENLISIKDLADLIASFSPSRVTKVVFSKEAEKLPYLPFKLGIMDTRDIRNLGWKPLVDISNTFKWTIESFM